VVSRLLDQGNFSGTPKKQVLIQGRVGDLLGKGVDFSPVQQKAGKKKAKLFPALG
jgi:hypothetical protein